MGKIDFKHLFHGPTWLSKIRSRGYGSNFPKMAFLTSGEAATLQKELAELTQLQALAFSLFFPGCWGLEFGNLRVVILSVP